ncbi:MAG: bifunctional UDP-N-acetylglucosamine diphosphorylase/glucosamine-1-phosphate N-acetyltransferase GlmU [Cyanobacteria bacterium J06639_1]
MAGDREAAKPLAVAILAAGKGTRMKSSLPKVLHELGGRSLVERVVRTVLPLKPERCFVIVGYAQERVRAALSDYPVEFVEQLEQNGTGHAVQQVLPHLTGFAGDLLVLNADVPLLRESTLHELLQTHRNRHTAATVLSACVPDPTGYGRAICDTDLNLSAIVEHRDCTPAQRQVNRINSGIYCFRWPDLATSLPQLSTANDQKEYYLTDAIALVPQAIAVDVADSREIQGINDRVQLAQAYATLQERIKEFWMRAGVTLVDPASITIDDDVQLEPDAIVEPQTHLRGTTVVRSGCHIGPNTTLENSTIGANSRVTYSVVTDAEVGANSRIGPFAHLRGDARVGDRCRIGNFVEVKNSTLQADTNAAHLSYLGDASLGEQVNIGAGTITANYDGKYKHRTIVGDRSKTGSNTVLVAPISLGNDVTTGAGSVVTESVEDDCLVLARSRQVSIPGWRPAWARESSPTSDEKS